MFRHVFVAGVVVFAIGCSPSNNSSNSTPDAGMMDKAPDATPYTCDCPDTGIGCQTTGNRVPDSDDLCVGLADGETTSGSPDAPGCPNTCSCVCYDEKCYLSACTKIGGCQECPVFR